MNIPKALIGSLGHLNPIGFSLQYLQGPSHIALVFDGLSRKPDKSPKSFNTTIALWTVFESLQNRVVSSANWPILNSFPKIVIRCISSSCLILQASSSTARINKYGDGERPCLTPLNSLKSLVQKPLFKTTLSELV